MANECIVCSPFRLSKKPHYISSTLRSPLIIVSIISESTSITLIASDEPRSKAQRQVRARILIRVVTRSETRGVSSGKSSSVLCKHSPAGGNSSPGRAARAGQGAQTSAQSRRGGVRHLRDMKGLELEAPGARARDRKKEER